jgi:hypothetical protein
MTCELRRGTPKPPFARRIGLALALVASLAACQGCNTIKLVYAYTMDRTNDAGDIIDIGVSVSWKRCVSFYLCGLGLAVVGAGYFDGWFVGLGGGCLGVRRHYHKMIGLGLYSYEEAAWGLPWESLDITDPDVVNRRHGCLFGWLLYPPPERGGRFS